MRERGTARTGTRVSVAGWPGGVWTSEGAFELVNLPNSSDFDRTRREWLLFAHPDKVEAVLGDLADAGEIEHLRDDPLRSALDGFWAVMRYIVNPMSYFVTELMRMLSMSRRLNAAQFPRDCLLYTSDAADE